MPLQINNLRFVGTGKPMKPDLRNLRLTREPSARGVIQSGVENVREFRQINKIKNTPNPKEIGEYSSRVMKKITTGSKVDLVA